MSIVNGERGVAFLGTKNQPFKKGIYGIDVMSFKRNDGSYGNIVYNDLEKAKRLKALVDRQGGYLSITNPNDIIENGEALEYDDLDIKTFTDAKFGQGTYDKIKMKY